MEYIEARPLPDCCLSCTEQDEGCCDECDHLGEHFILSEEDRRQLDMLVEERIKERQPLRQKRHRSLEERLVEYYGKPIDEIDNITDDPEVDWGTPKGAEL